MYDCVRSQDQHLEPAKLGYMHDCVDMCVLSEEWRVGTKLVPANQQLSGRVLKKTPHVTPYKRDASNPHW